MQVADTPVNIRQDIMHFFSRSIRARLRVHENGVWVRLGVQDGVGCVLSAYESYVRETVSAIKRII